MLARRKFLFSAISLAAAIILEMFGLKKPEPMTGERYRFSIGKTVLKNRPGEIFNAKIYWPGEIAGCADPAVIKRGNG